MQLRKKQRRNNPARDISYASSVSSRRAQVLVRTMENLTGRPRLIRRAAGYQDEVAAGADFWQVMAHRYNLRLDLQGSSLDSIPRTGPLVAVANHPFGILDGLVMGGVLSQTRGDFRILANRVFRRAEALDDVILPVSFDGTRAAQATNIETRKRAIDYLHNGGAIGIFPGGTVSTAPRPFGRAMDPRWRTFTARLIAKSQASVVPIYFDGTNSRLFQVASHMHSTLRMGLLVREFKRSVRAPVRMVVGAPLDPAQVQARAGDARAMMDFLRESTYALSPRPLADLSYGFEFEDHHR